MPAVYDDMTGLGLLPAGLFSFGEERHVGNIIGLRKEMHLLWTIPIERPGLSGIVHSSYLSNG